MAMKRHIAEAEITTNECTVYQCPHCDYRIRLFNDGHLERLKWGDASAIHSWGDLAESTANVSVRHSN